MKFLILAVLSEKDFCDSKKAFKKDELLKGKVSINPPRGQKLEFVKMLDYFTKTIK